MKLCTNPEYAAEVSIQPLEIIGVDALIMFSDILTPLMGMGIDLDFVPGPVIGNPIKNEQDIKSLKPLYPEESTDYVGKIIKLILGQIRKQVPLIGFAGAPFTLACYLIEGGNSKRYANTIRLLYDEPRQAHLLMEKLTLMTIEYLNYQIESGVQMIQLFDTWAGILSRESYSEFIQPYVMQIFSSLKKKGTVPRVYYVNGGAHLLTTEADLGADVIGLDWRVDIGEVRHQIGNKVALQGNLDPNILFCSKEVIREQTKKILKKFGNKSGHIFNLGHGIDKEVNPDHLITMVNTVKEHSVRKTV